MEQCKFVEIEEGEFEVEFGDIDAEGGEVEMVCGDKIVDVPWNQFKRNLSIDPQRYINNLESFKREVSCLINESSNEKVVRGRRRETAPSRASPCRRSARSYACW